MYEERMRSLSLKSVMYSLHSGGEMKIELVSRLVPRTRKSLYAQACVLCVDVDDNREFSREMPR